MWHLSFFFNTVLSCLLYAHFFLYTVLFLHIHIYVRMCMCACVWVCTNACTHTYTHTFPLWRKLCNACLSWLNHILLIHPSASYLTYNISSINTYRKDYFLRPSGCPFQMNNSEFTYLSYEGAQWFTENTLVLIFNIKCQHGKDKHFKNTCIIKPFIWFKCKITSRIYCIAVDVLCWIKKSVFL